MPQTNDSPFVGGEKLRLVKFRKCHNALFAMTMCRPNSKTLHLFTFSGAAETRVETVPMPGYLNRDCTDVKREDGCNSLR